MGIGIYHELLLLYKDGHAIALCSWMLLRGLQREKTCPVLKDHRGKLVMRHLEPAGSRNLQLARESHALTKRNPFAPLRFFTFVLILFFSIQHHSLFFFFFPPNKYFPLRSKKRFVLQSARLPVGSRPPASNSSRSTLAIYAIRGLKKERLSQRECEIRCPDEQRHASTLGH